MKKATVRVLYAPGTNSHEETLFAFRRVGADAELLQLRDVRRGFAQLDEGDVLCIPGGFSYGDHLGAGALLGQLLRIELADQLERAAAKPMLAICNGFQVAMRAGLFGTGIALTPNKGGTFRHILDQEHVIERDTPSVWLQGLAGETMRFACAHGEGRLIFDDDSRSSGAWSAAIRYPKGANPDGSQEDIGGIASADGMILGLMDHPERLLDDGRNEEIFRNGVAR